MKVPALLIEWMKLEKPSGSFGSNPKPSLTGPLAGPNGKQLAMRLRAHDDQAHSGLHELGGSDI
jgi:hypothetical protein